MTVDLIANKRSASKLWPTLKTAHDQEDAALGAITAFPKKKQAKQIRELY